MVTRIQRLVESTFRSFQPIKEAGNNLIQIKLKGMGTPETGFVDDQWGPFNCGHCDWFRNGKFCIHPAIKADKKIKNRSKNGIPIVGPNDCSNRFWAKGVTVQQYLSGKRN